MDTVRAQSVRAAALTAALALAAFALCWAVWPAHYAVAQEPDVEVDVQSLGALLSQAPTSAASPIAQVERVDFGSRGATITLQGGQTILLDFSGVSGVGGGPNYVAWAMVLFGLSVITRLLSTLARLGAPFSRRRGRTRRRDDD